MVYNFFLLLFCRPIKLQLLFSNLFAFYLKNVTKCVCIVLFFFFNQHFVLTRRQCVLEKNSSKIAYANFLFCFAFFVLIQQLTIPK